MIVGADLHTHTTLGDGKLSVKGLVDYYGKRGIKILAVTDHAHDRHGGIITKNNFDAYLNEIEENKKYANERYGMLLISGVEVSSDYQGAHILSLPAVKYISPLMNYKKVLKIINDSSCYSVACHPDDCSSEYHYKVLWDERHNIKDLVFAWEAFNSKNVYHFDEILKNKWNFIASSDFHEPGNHDINFRMMLKLRSLDFNSVISSIREKKLQPILGFPNFHNQ